jgi:glycosyltransferase involved in cell wall biosynthesis
MPLATLPPLAAEPLVSVLIVNYNYERYIGEAIESVLRQTYQRFEIIICDDGSTDGSRDLIRRYADGERRIRFIFKENAAVAAALNDAYAASAGEIICPLDADDLFEPSKIARVVAAFAAGGDRVGMVMNTLRKIDSEGRDIGKMPQFGSFDRGELRDAILRSSGHFAAAPTSGISFRRACADRVFPIPPDEFRSEADGYMRLVAALYYAVEVIDEPLTVYRVHSSNVTASQTVDLKWCERVIAASERIFGATASTAAREGWQIAPLERSFGYCEAVAMRDYLQRRDLRTRIGNARRVNAAAATIETPDRRKTRVKGFVLILATLLPLALGKRILDAVYLPNSLKRALSARAGSR